MDRSQVAHNWASRGFGCDLWVDLPGQVWEDYRHDVDELLMIMEGRLELEIDGKVIHPKVGEEIFIPAKALHSVRNIGGTTSKWLYGYQRR